MPRMKVAGSSILGFVQLTNAVGIALTEGEIEAFSRREVTISTEGYELTIEGSGLTARQGVLTGGTISRIGIVISDESVVNEPVFAGTITDFGDAGDLFAAASRARNADVATDTYLYGLDWTATGSISVNTLSDAASGFSGVASNWRGDDVLRGKGGTDLLSAGDGKDKVYGGEGNDFLHGNEGRDRVFGDAGDDNLFGDGGTDRLSGGAGNDFLYGGEARDVLFGGDGVDRIDGGAGRDVLSGGRGGDVFNFLDGTGGHGRDRILDYDPAEDRLSGDFEDATMTQTDAGVRLDHDGGSILFVGLTLSDFDL